MGRLECDHIKPVITLSGFHCIKKTIFVLVMVLNISFHSICFADGHPVRVSFWRAVRPNDVTLLHDHHVLRLLSSHHPLRDVVLHHEALRRQTQSRKFIFYILRILLSLPLCLNHKRALKFLHLSNFKGPYNT